MSELREKLEILIEMAPQMREAGVLQGSAEGVTFVLAPFQPAPVVVEGGEDKEQIDLTDLRPKALREREQSKRERGY